MADGDGGGKTTPAAEIQRRRDDAAKAFLERGGAAPQQLPLMPALAGAAFAEPESEEHVGADAPKRGPGRPAGSVNRRNAEFVEFLEKMGYSSPLQAAAEVWSRPLEVLRQELGCKLLEAHDRQMQAINYALPYWHQKLPQAIELSDGGDMTVAMLPPQVLLAMLMAQGEHDKVAARAVEFLAPLIEHMPTAAPPSEEEAGDGPEA